MLYRILALRDFHDGNVFNRRIRQGETLEVEPYKYDQAKLSDPQGWQLLGKVVPPSSVNKVDATTSSLYQAEEDDET